jgi:hypothetical protein
MVDSLKRRLTQQSLIELAHMVSFLEYKKPKKWTLLNNDEKLNVIRMGYIPHSWDVMTETGYIDTNVTETLKYFAESIPLIEYKDIEYRRHFGKGEKERLERIRILIGNFLVDNHDLITQKKFGEKAPPEIEQKEEIIAKISKYKTARDEYIKHKDNNRSLLGVKKDNQYEQLKNKHKVHFEEIIQLDLDRFSSFKLVKNKYIDDKYLTEIENKLNKEIATAIENVNLTNESFEKNKILFELKSLSTYFFNCQDIIDNIQSISNESLYKQYYTILTEIIEIKKIWETPTNKAIKDRILNENFGKKNKDKTILSEIVSEIPDNEIIKKLFSYNWFDTDLVPNPKKELKSEREIYESNLYNWSILRKHKYIEKINADSNSDIYELFDKLIDKKQREFLLVQKIKLQLFEFLDLKKGMYATYNEFLEDDYLTTLVDYNKNLNLEIKIGNILGDDDDDDDYFADATDKPGEAAPAPAAGEGRTFNILKLENPSQNWTEANAQLLAEGKCGKGSRTMAGLARLAPVCNDEKIIRVVYWKSKEHTKKEIKSLDLNYDDINKQVGDFIKSNISPTVAGFLGYSGGFPSSYKKNSRTKRNTKKNSRTKRNTKKNSRTKRNTKKNSRTKRKNKKNSRTKRNTKKNSRKKQNTKKNKK